MKPYYQDNHCTIYHGDCREILPRLDSDSLDMLCTDPPYGIGFSRYESHDDKPDEYSALMRFVITESCRIIGEGPAFVWQGMKNAEQWHRWFPQGYRIMAACKGFVQFRPTPIQYSWDPVIYWGSGTGEASVHKKDWHVQRIAPFGAKREKIKHPCPRPMEQVRYFLSLVNAGSVLDPFVGSGSTLIAAKDLGRKAIGIEIEEKYCEVAAKRLAQEVFDFTGQEKQAS